MIGIPCVILTLIFFETLTYQDALEHQIKVMDAAAFSLCMEKRHSFSGL